MECGWSVHARSCDDEAVGYLTPIYPSVMIASIPICRLQFHSVLSVCKSISIDLPPPTPQFKYVLIEYKQTNKQTTVPISVFEL